MSKPLSEKFTSIYLKYYKQLVSYAYFRVSDFGLAEELVQESFLKTWNYSHGLNNKLLKPKSFLYRVLKNQIIDFYKKNHNQVLSFEQVSEDKLTNKIILEEVIDNKINYDMVVGSIKSLDKKYKMVLIYRYVKGFSIEKICQKTGLSPNHVSVMIYKGLNILKKSLALNNKDRVLQFH